MYYVLASLGGCVVGIVLTELFGARVVSKVRADLFAVETRITTAIKTAANKL